MGDEIKAGAIYSLIPKAMAEVGHIAKARQAGQGGNDRGPSYKFRGIDDVYKAIQPVFAKLGIFCAPSVVDQKREERTSSAGKAIIYTILTVQHRFYAGDGSFVDVVTVGEAMDSSDKSSNKAMSAAMKYAAIELLSIPTEEGIDTENENHEVQSKAQQEAAALWTAMEQAPDLAALDALVARVKLLPEAMRAELRDVYANRKKQLAPLAGAQNRGAHAERALLANQQTLVEPSPDIKPPPDHAAEDALTVEVRDLIKAFNVVKGKPQMVKLMSRWEALPYDERTSMQPYAEDAVKRTGYAYTFPKPPDPTDDLPEGLR